MTLGGEYGGLLGGSRIEKGWRQREEGREDGDDAQVGGSATSSDVCLYLAAPCSDASLPINAGPAVQLRRNTRPEGKKRMVLKMLYVEIN